MELVQSLQNLQLEDERLPSQKARHITGPVMFNQKKFIKNNENKGVLYYRCSKFRQGCRATLQIENGKAKPGKAPHTCECPSNNNETEAQSAVEEVFWTEIDNGAQDYKNHPQKIWEEVNEKVAKSFAEKAFRLPPKSSAFARIKSLRNTNTDAINLVSSLPHSHFEDGTPFWRRTWSGEINSKPVSYIIWSSAVSLSIIGESKKFLIDGTFRTSPSNFRQLLIVMAFSDKTGLYIPVAYILTTHAIDELYFHCLWELFSVSGDKWRPDLIITDFEQALHLAVKRLFPNSIIYGCYFHWRQAIRRKIVKLGLTKELNYDLLMKSLEKLTLTPLEQFDDVLETIQQSFTNFSNFFTYFKRTWLKRFPPQVWNCSALRLEEEDIIIRTNCALESYNKRLNERIKPHPHILALVEHLKEESIWFKGRYTKIHIDRTEEPVDRANDLKMLSDSQVQEWLRELQQLNKETSKRGSIPRGRRKR